MICKAQRRHKHHLPAPLCSFTAVILTIFPIPFHWRLLLFDLLLCYFYFCFVLLLFFSKKSVSKAIPPLRPLRGIIRTCDFRLTVRMRKTWREAESPPAGTKLRTSHHRSHEPGDNSVERQSAGRCLLKGLKEAIVNLELFQRRHCRPFWETGLLNLLIAHNISDKDIEQTRHIMRQVHRQAASS